MIRLRLFGGLDLRAADGQELQAVLAQPKRVALLVYLALARPRGAHQRDKLLALFWPEQDDERARNALNQAVHFLRRILGERSIVSPNTECVSLDATNVWCDAAAFESALDAGRIGDALELYRGDLLDGFHIANAPDFERWLQVERERLGGLYEKALEAIAAEREATADYSAAIPHRQRLAARNPSNSAIALRLMRALAASGDAAGAVKHGRAHDAHLRDELAVPLPVEIGALMKELQSNPVAVRPPRLDLAAGTTETIEPRARAAVRGRASISQTVLGAAAVTVLIAATAILATNRVDARPRDGRPEELYRRGTYAMSNLTRHGIEEARTAFLAALEIDSTFAPAWAGLSNVYRTMSLGYMNVDGARDSARLFAERGIALDNRLPMTHAALAVVLADAGHFDAAEVEFKAALQRDSLSSRTHSNYALLLVALGRGDEALREAQRAVATAPMPGRSAFIATRYAEYVAMGTRTYMLMPAGSRWSAVLRAEPAQPWGYRADAYDLARAGQCSRGRAQMDKMRTLSDDATLSRIALAAFEWWCGRPAAARTMLAAVKETPDARYLGIHIANAHAIFGEIDSVFSVLARTEWQLNNMAELRAGWFLDPIRKDARYDKLLRSLHLADARGRDLSRSPR